MYILVVAESRARAPETTGRRWNGVRRNHMVCHLEKNKRLCYHYLQSMAHYPQDKETYEVTKRRPFYSNSNYWDKVARRLVTMWTWYHIICDWKQNAVVVEEGPELFPEGNTKNKQIPTNQTKKTWVYS